MIDSHLVIPALRYESCRNELDRIKCRIKWLHDLQQAKQMYKNINPTMITDKDEIEVNKHILSDLEYLLNKLEEVTNELGNLQYEWQKWEREE